MQLPIEVRVTRQRNTIWIMIVIILFMLFMIARLCHQLQEANITIDALTIDREV